MPAAENDARRRLAHSGDHLGKAEPRSMSPPTVLSSMSSDGYLCFLYAASSGMMCSYLVVFVSGGSITCPSTCPMIVMQ